MSFSRTPSTYHLRAHALNFPTFRENRIFPLHYSYTFVDCDLASRYAGLVAELEPRCRVTPFPNPFEGGAGEEAEGKAGGEAERARGGTTCCARRTTPRRPKSRE